MLIQSIDAYITLRRSLGIEMLNEKYLLHSFARFAAGRHEIHVRAESAVEWAALGPSPWERERRLRTLARFAIHARVENSRHEVPPTGLFARRSVRPLPCVYSEEDIGRLMAAASRLCPVGSLRPDTYTTLFGLLASTGLRIAEALTLPIGDVTRDGLVIRETKFHKTRLVPLHPTTEAALNRYLGRWRHAARACEPVFVSIHGGKLVYYSVRNTFLRLAHEVGLPIRRGHRHPRIHDLRHTFAVRALETAPGDSLSVGRHLRALSTYMGHAQFASTYWYLQATPRLTKSVADACEAFLQGGAQ
jgi:integrase/recombinase XerD